MIGAERFDAEWWWVFCYGIGAVAVVVANLLPLCSVARNAFLHTNTHRALCLLAVRNVARAAFGLAVLYATRWSHPMQGWHMTDVNATKVTWITSRITSVGVANVASVVIRERKLDTRTCNATRKFYNAYGIKNFAPNLPCETAPRKCFHFNSLPLSK